MMRSLPDHTTPRSSVSNQAAQTRFLYVPVILTKLLILASYVDGYQYLGRIFADQTPQRCAAMLDDSDPNAKCQLDQTPPDSRPTGPLLQLCLFGKLLRFFLLPLCFRSLPIAFCFLPIFLLFLLLILLFLLFPFLVLFLLPLLFFLLFAFLVLLPFPILFFFSQRLWCFLPLLNVRVPPMSSRMLARIYWKRLQNLTH